MNEQLLVLSWDLSCGSKGLTKCRSVLSSLEFIWLQWRISRALHEQRNTEHQQQKRCLCFRGYLVLQTLGRRETGLVPKFPPVISPSQSEPSHVDAGEEQTH